MSAVAQYAITVETRPPEDQTFATVVEALVHAIGAQPPTAIQEEAVLEVLRERWPGAALSIARWRPTSTPGQVIWTVWRDRELADRDLAGMYHPPPRR